ncbi:MAG TPA: hypothetical protein VHC70_06835 [Phycisphaerales bacterium]|jgi:hypothetical protein|nr:hypothetical protein [Phycisphaerales bacterium]
MGVLTDIFVADRSLLASVLEAGPRPPLPVLDSKGVDTVKMATLATVLEGGDLDDIPAVLDRSPSMQMEAGDDGPWIFAVPDPVVSGLASMDAARRRDVASRWAQTEEWRMADWPVDLYNDWFNALADLAKVAVERGSHLWMWMCL